MDLFSCSPGSDVCSSISGLCCVCKQGGMTLYWGGAGLLRSWLLGHLCVFANAVGCWLYGGWASVHLAARLGLGMQGHCSLSDLLATWWTGFSCVQVLHLGWLCQQALWCDRADFQMAVALGAGAHGSPAMLVSPLCKSAYSLGLGV